MRFRFFIPSGQGGRIELYRVVAYERSRFQDWALYRVAGLSDSAFPASSPESAKIRAYTGDPKK